MSTSEGVHPAHANLQQSNPQQPGPSHAPTSCPASADIERLALDGTVPMDVSAHIAGCAACTSRLARVRDDATFLSRMRHLATDGMGPAGAPRIPGYRDLGVLSTGAQGVVYRAIQEATQRPVAIKTLVGGRSSTMKQRLRAEREAEIVASLRHPNIVSVFESRTLWDGQIAVVMEFVDGIALDQWALSLRASDQAMPHAQRIRAIVRVVADVCHAVHHAHLNGVIHRDLKPDNILVTTHALHRTLPDSPDLPPRPVVLDFGIAKVGPFASLHEEGSGAGSVQTPRQRQGPSITGDFAGTPAYASPEQVSGRSGEVDALTDVYSLGVVLYRTLTDASPYELEGSIFDMARTIREAPPRPPRSLDASIPKELESITLHALHKDKRLRYLSAGAMAKDLERFLDGEPIEAMSSARAYLLRKTIYANRRPIAYGGIVLGALLAAALVAGSSLSRARRAAFAEASQRQLAQEESVRARAVAELLRGMAPSEQDTQRQFGRLANSGMGQLYFRLETGEFAGDPALDQTLRRMWGQVFTGVGGRRATGLAAYSEVSLRGGLERLRAEHEGDHEEVASTLHNLAGLMLQRGRPNEALDQVREALSMRERVLGIKHHATIDSRGLLARTLIDLHREDEAREVAGLAIAQLVQVGTPESDLTLAMLQSLVGRSLVGLREAQQAEQLVRASLALRLRYLPANDGELLESYEDLARFVELSPASGLAGHASATWGDASPARIREDARVLALADRPDDAIPTRQGRTQALERLLVLQGELLGNDDLARVRTCMATMITAQAEGELPARLRVAMEAARVLQVHFGRDDLRIVACLTEAATTQAWLGNPSQAAALQARACAIRDRVPPGARDALLSGNHHRNLGFFLAQAGKHEEAVRALDEALSRITSSLGEDHYVAILCKAQLAWSLWNLGEHARAEQLSTMALDAAASVPTFHTDQRQLIMALRGRILIAQGQPGAGLELLESAWSPSIKANPPTMEFRRSMVLEAIGASEALGDKVARARWAARLEDNEDEALGTSGEAR